MKLATLLQDVVSAVLFAASIVVFLFPIDRHRNKSFHRVGGKVPYLQTMSDVLDQLQRWYAQHCNGEWEHSYGISIQTLDNPGWRVKIDLHQTDLESKIL